MYIVSTNGGRSEYVCAYGDDVVFLANILEAKKEIFNVSSRCGKMKQEEFDIRGFEFWETDFN